MTDALEVTQYPGASVGRENSHDRASPSSSAATPSVAFHSSMDGDSRDLSKANAPSGSHKPRRKAVRHAVQTKTVAFPTNAKLIGPVHRLPSITSPVGTGAEKVASRGSNLPSSVSGSYGYDSGTSNTRARQSSNRTPATTAGPSGYQWTPNNGGGGGVYVKKNFWNLHRATGTRCESAVSTQAMVALHSQGSHLSLHQSKPVSNQELDTFVRVTQPLAKAPGKHQHTRTRSCPAGGSFSEYFMCFRPRRQLRQLQFPAATSPSERAASSQATHHSRNGQSFATVLNIQHMQAPLQPASSSRYSSGRRSLQGSSKHHATSVEFDVHADSVVSIQPAARPCTPATGLHARGTRVYGRGKHTEDGSADDNSNLALGQTSAQDLDDRDVERSSQALCSPTDDVTAGSSTEQTLDVENDGERGEAVDHSTIDLDAVVHSTEPLAPAPESADVKRTTNKGT